MRKKPKRSVSNRYTHVSVCNIFTFNCLQKEKTSASVFGGAKPVDTAARERAIEEKLLQEQEELEKKLEKEKEKEKEKDFERSRDQDRVRRDSEGDDNRRRRKRSDSREDG